MATKMSRAANAQKKEVKNPKRAAMAQKRNAQAQQNKAKAAVNNFSNPKTNEMGQTKCGNAKIESKDIRVGISFFMSHPTAGHQVIDFATNLERFTKTCEHVNQSPENTYSSMYHFHKRLMELYVSDKPIDEHFFTTAMHYMVAFGSIKNALNSDKFKDYGFMIGPKYNDFEDAMIATLDYDSWDHIRKTRNAA